MPLPPVSGPFRPFRGHGRRFVRPERTTAWCGDRRFRRSPGLFQELEDLLGGDGEDPEGRVRWGFARTSDDKFVIFFVPDAGAR